jgi:uncharacterized delta-60 repeat protein
MTEFSNEGVSVSSIARIMHQSPREFAMKKTWWLAAVVIFGVFLGCGGGSDTRVISSSSKAITAYALGSISGTINDTEKTISVLMPPDTDVTALVAVFITTGSSVKVGSTIQTSGSTPNDFSDPVVYTVTAADGTTQDYTVTVTVSSSRCGFLDESFGTKGVATTSIGEGNDYALAGDIQGDGKIGVAVYSHDGSRYDFALARYNMDGSLDASFGSGGKVTTPVGSGDAAARGLAIQPDGKIVAVGVSYNAGNSDFTVVRYDPEGRLDATFGPQQNGIVTTAIGNADDVANTVSLQTDGKIVVAGYSYNGANNDFAVVRYLEDGGLDSSFGTGGKVTTPVGGGYDIAYALGIQEDGGILAGGVSYNGANNDFAVVRYLEDGSLDSSFGTGGKVTTPVGAFLDIAYALGLQSDGKIVLAGASNDGQRNVFALVRYDPDGGLDSGFGVGGKVTTAIGDRFAAASALAVQTDGKIVAAGMAYDEANSDVVLVRYQEDGRLDPSFAAEGISTISLGVGYDVAGAVKCQTDGKIVVAGYAYSGGSYDFVLLRYWP